MSEYLATISQEVIKNKTVYIINWCYGNSVKQLRNTWKKTLPHKPLLAAAPIKNTNAFVFLNSHSRVPTAQDSYQFDFYRNVLGANFPIKFRHLFLAQERNLYVVAD